MRTRHTVVALLALLPMSTAAFGQERKPEQGELNYAEIPLDYKYKKDDTVAKREVVLPELMAYHSSGHFAAAGQLQHRHNRRRRRASAHAIPSRNRDHSGQRQRNVEPQFRNYLPE